MISSCRSLVRMVRVVLLVAVSVSGCAGLYQQPLTLQERVAMQERVLEVSYEQVFRAVRMSAEDVGYAITTADKAQGLIDTEWRELTSEAAQVYGFLENKTLQGRRNMSLETLGPTRTRVRLRLYGRVMNRYGMTGPAQESENAAEYVAVFNDIRQRLGLPEEAMPTKAETPPPTPGSSTGTSSPEE